MWSNIDKINSIPFLDVLWALWYSEWKDYIIQQKDIIRMKDWWKVTDWWVGSINKWILNCFSGVKGSRIEGDRLDLVKMKYWINDYEAFKWFEEKFNIEKMQNTEEKNESVVDKWRSLEPISENSYLASRWIDPSLLSWIIKQWQYGVSLPIRTANWNITSIQTRTNKEEKKERYRIEGAQNSKWLFYDWIPDNWPLYLVEGFTDYLTLRQFTPNVIWLVSALTWISELKALVKQRELLYLFDADDTWEQSVELLKENGIKLRLAHLNEFSDDVKDVNDLWQVVKWMWLGDKELFSTIEDISERRISNLELAFSEAEWMKQKWVIKFGDNVLDKMTWWLMRGSTTLINWPSGQWKTTLSLHMLRLLLKQKDLKIVYYSLETNVWRQIMKIISFLSGKKEKEIFHNLSDYKHYIDRLWTLELYDNIRDLDDIKQHITDNNVDVAFIDFAQKVRVKGIKDETEKMIKYAQDLQDFAIDNWEVAIISLSQTPMSNFNQVPILARTPKNSGALFESSDTTMNVWRDENGKWVIGFMKTKSIEAEGWWSICSTFYNPSTWEYNIFPPDNFKSQDENEKSFAL